MKTSKTFVLAALFSFAVASPWVAGTSLAGGPKAGGTPPAATVKKSYNSGQSTTGYTAACPNSGSGCKGTIGAYGTSGSGGGKSK